MNKWVYRILMSVLAIMIATQIYVAVTTVPPIPQCLLGIVMVPDKGKDMYVQQGLWPTYCVPIDKD
jgi:hypothetical protein